MKAVRREGCDWDWAARKGFEKRFTDQDLVEVVCDASGDKGDLETSEAWLIARRLDP